MVPTFDDATVTWDSPFFTFDGGGAGQLPFFNQLRPITEVRLTDLDLPKFGLPDFW